MRTGRGFGRDLLIAVLATLIVAALMRLLLGDTHSETVWTVEYRHSPRAGR